MSHFKMAFLHTYLLLLFTLSTQHLLSVTGTEYSVKFPENSLDLILNEKKNLELHLKPRLEENSSSIDVKFVCQNSDDDSRIDWNSTDPKCSMFKLITGYEYAFLPHSNSTISLVIEGLKPGKQQLVGNARQLDTNNTIDDAKAFISVNVGRSSTILLVSAIIGWIYFVVWSISFYPQIWENIRRKSVAGLNIDFAFLNFTGFLSYSIFNVALYYVPEAQKEYVAKHPRSQIPVEFNDVVFALHAFVCCTIVVCHFLIYERGEQRMSWFSRIFLSVVWLGYPILGGLVFLTKTITILQLVYILSYVKLAVTLIKYIPQGYYNYKRKSTVGWSIVNIFLDMTGGLLSMGQMFMLAHNYDDWATIFNNFTKFGLGMISILFDVFFLIQHYILYRGDRSTSTNSLIEDGYQRPGSPTASQEQSSQRQVARM